MTTKFWRNMKKRGYFSACRGRIKKLRKHAGGRGNASNMHHHRIPFGKNHPAYFGKVSMRYFHRCMNLSKQERTVTSSAQNDMAEQAVYDDEENPLEVPLSKLVEDVFDEIPKRNEVDLDVQKLITMGEDSQQEVLKVEGSLEKKSEINEEHVFNKNP
ncbi:uncharacterized protein [Nicotiana sylvestris]|uniref:uncharacterized protein n=1 Tax=Nicotiana sylvestris TaxID=4096 RepID=UPI00388CA209